MLRRRRNPLLLLCLLAFPLFLSSYPETRPDTLPPQLSGWERTALELVQANELARLAGEEAALLVEYGSREARRARYQRSSADWRVTVHRMHDRSSAYGAFTLLRRQGNPLGFGEAAARASNGIVFYQGNYLVSADREADPAALRELAERLAGMQGPQPSLPLLPSYLPSGFIPNSDCYLLGPLAAAEVLPIDYGDWLGFSYGGEAEVARYDVDGAEATLLLLSYPTPQIAAERLRDFRRLFNLNGEGSPGRPLAYAKRRGTLVFFALGLKSAASATALFDSVKYGAELSWSEPKETKADPDWAATLMELFIGTGVFLLVGLLLGLGFAAVRLLVKRLWPEKVFDRKDSVEIIRLNLNRKT